MTMFKGLLSVLLAVMLSGCSGWWGGGEEEKLPGKRISIMALEDSVKPDPRLADLAVRLPKPFSNQSWPQAGGFANHAMHHLSAKGNLREIWRESIGEGSSSDKQLLGEPVLEGKRIYTIDADAEVRAFDANSGDQIWEWKIRPERGDDAEGTLGGGIAWANGRIIATTGFGMVAALDAGNGKVLWRRSLNAPIRSAPTIFGGRVFAVTIANETYALDARDGRELWTHTGITENAGLIGGASPAATGSTIVVSYTSGELVALRMENGRQIWSDSLTALRRTDPVSTLSHIRGRPIIYDGSVIAVANSGRTVAIDLRTGTRIWERSIGSSQSPWIAGNYLYIVSNSGQVVCLARQTGGVRWSAQLPQFEDEEDREDPIIWGGPALAGDRLLVGGSHGEVWSVSPYTGRFLGRIELSDPVFIAPIVANDTVYFLTDDARLTALR